MSFVIIQGLARSEKTPVEFIERIVYGNPRIDVVEIGTRIVALCEFSDEQDVQCAATFNRIGSFSGLGAQLINDQDVALREFGIWVRHHAPGTIVGLKADPNRHLKAAARGMGDLPIGSHDDGE